MTQRSDTIAIVVAGVAQVCLEAAISLLDGHAEMAKIGRDLEDVIDREKKRIEAEAGHDVEN